MGVLEELRDEVVKLTALMRELAEEIARLRNRDLNGHTIADAAEKLGISQGTVRTMVLSGQLPSVKIGRARRIPESALANVLENGSKVR